MATKRKPYRPQSSSRPRHGDIWERRKQDTEIARWADEVEFRALKEGSSSLSEALRDDRMDGSLLEKEETTKGEFYGHSTVDDGVISAVSMELKRRENLLKSAWPFKLSAGGLTLESRSTSQSLVYEFCLAVARAPSITEGDFKQLPKHFERASLSVLQHWLGFHSQGMRTGWPREDDAPTRAKELFGEVCRMAGDREWKWSPEPGLPQDPSPTHLKEAKLDLLAWLQMPDRFGHVYFAGQCACSFKDMEDKARELTAGGLMQWLRPLSWVPFVRCFFVPFHLPPQRLQEIIKLGGATFDRARLAMIAEKLPADDAKKLKKELQSAVELVVSR
ncbi:MAG: hypothetical protein K9N47_24980 [Prosthecobacter sp.]|uniref:hypothetical protein n=1 Tax=Prosthecobacter sp. TaxID=1965333 RepID=UPI00261A51B1|nr:hypothetical protein [Prosthecobacter sp.]MCF7789400.1 hypothetical protein [Prosthecobacter sp.]